MSIITVVIVLIAIGVMLWAVTSFIPMAAPIKQLLVAVVVIAVIMWLLQVFGVLGALHAARVR